MKLTGDNNSQINIEYTPPLPFFISGGMIVDCFEHLTHKNCEYMTDTLKQIGTHTNMLHATYISCTPLFWCWILRATSRTAVMNKTTVTWSCVCVCVCVGSADVLAFK